MRQRYWKDGPFARTATPNKGVASFIHSGNWRITNVLQRKTVTSGPLMPWVWSRSGEQTGRAAYHAKEQHLVRDYRARAYGGEWETVTQSIPLTYAECHYGGTRPYFRCNGIVNGRHRLRRVGKLFAGGRYFLCRHCYNVAYTSQSEPRYDRMLRRANKLRSRWAANPARQTG